MEFCLILQLSLTKGKYHTVNSNEIQIKQSCLYVTLKILYKVQITYKTTNMQMESYRSGGLEFEFDSTLKTVKRARCIFALW